MTPRRVTFVFSNREARRKAIRTANGTLPEPTPRHECADPYCEENSGFGNTKRFCKKHAERLAEIRESFEVEEGKGQYHRRRDRTGRTTGSTCCTVGCENPRDRGRAYCSTCEEAGMNEEDKLDAFQS